MTDISAIVNVVSRVLVVAMIAYVVYRRVHCGSACSRLGVAATGWFGWLTGFVGVLGLVAPACGAVLAVALSLYLLDWCYEHETQVADRHHEKVSTRPNGARPRSGDV